MPISEELAAAEISNALQLERVKLNLVNSALAILEKLQERLIADLSSNDPTEPAKKIYQQWRLEAAIANCKKVSGEYYGNISGRFKESAVELAKVNQTTFAKAIENLLGADIISVDLSAGVIKSIVEGSLSNGATTAEWFKRQSAKLTQDYSDTLTEGLASGESLSQLIRRVRGTREAAYADGIFGIARNNAASLVKTSTQSVLQDARFSLYKDNADLIKGVQWLSTLDRRTSGICKALSGSTWDLEGNPISATGKLKAPPAHWGCRSTLLSLLKSWAELSNNPQMRLPGVGRGDFETLFRKKLAARGLSNDKIEIAVSSARTRLNGKAIPGGLTYSQWLKQQSPEAQKEALGAGRYELYKAGKIDTSDLINGQLRPLTIRELEKLSTKQDTSATE